MTCGPRCTNEREHIHSEPVPFDPRPPLLLPSLHRCQRPRWSSPRRRQCQWLLQTSFVNELLVITHLELQSTTSFCASSLHMAFAPWPATKFPPCDLLLLHFFLGLFKIFLHHWHHFLGGQFPSRLQVESCALWAVGWMADWQWAKVH